MPRPRIVVPDDHPTVFASSAAAERLRRFAEVGVSTEPGAEVAAELVRRVGDAEGAINIRAYAKYTSAVIEQCPKLRVISIWGTGTDNVDLEACKRRGIAVLNTPGVNAHAVAEHTLALMLSVLRHIPAMSAELRSGAWARAPLAQLEGRTVGIVGFGAIGRRVATLVSAFGARVLVHTRTPERGRVAAAGGRPVGIDELLRSAEIVTLHLRLDDATRGFINAERLALMKRSAILINTSRGALVDKAALITALKANAIAGAGLDVFHEEPVASGDELVSLSNVVATPHVAGNTPEVIAAGLDRAVQNLEDFFR